MSWGYRIGSSIALVVAALLIYMAPAAGGVQPSVGLYYTLNSNPQVGAGQAAPLWQLLIRTDTPSIYYKSGSANTAWTQLGGGGAGGAVTSVACGTGVSCTPNPIVATGTVALNITPTTCAAGSAEISTAANGTSSCAAFVNAAGTGLSLAGSTLSVNLTPTTCAAGSAEISTAANGTSSCGVFVNAVGTGLSLSGSTASLNISPTTCGANQAEITTAADGTSTCGTFIPGANLSGTTSTIAKFTSSTAVGNSSATDDGTTFAINTNKVTVTESSGNTSIAGTLGVTGLTTATGGINSSGGVTTIGQLIGTVQADTSTGTTTDFSLNATTTTITWNGASSATWNGITGGAAGRRISIINISNGANTLTIGNESGTTANRTRLAGATNLVLTTQSNGSAGVILEYSSALSRWMEIARTNPVYGYQLELGGILNLNVGSARIQDSATAAAATSCGSGPSPSVTVGESFMTVTTGGGATGCVVTFGTAFSNTPTCTVTSQSGTQAAYTVSTTAVTLGTGTAAATNYDIVCIDH